MLKKIIYNASAQGLGKSISLLISILATALLTRNLGSSSYGQYVLIISFVNLLVAFGNWGTQIIGVRELSRTKKKALFFGSISFLRLALSLIAFFFGLIIILLAPPFKDVKWLAIFSLFLVLGLIVEASFEIVFQAFLKMDWKTIINLLGSGVFLGSTFVFLKSGFGLSAPILAWFLSRILVIFLSQRLSQKLIKEKPKIEKGLIKKLFYQSLPLGTLLVLFAAYDQAIDSFMIKYFLNPSQVGFYGLAYKIYANLVLPAYFLTNSIFPILSKKSKEGFKKVLRLGFLLMVLGLIFLVPLTVGLSRFFVFLIAGQEFSDSIPILKILAPALVFAYFNHLTGFSLIALDQQKTSLKIGFLALVWNLVLNLIFIPRSGIAAAAWVTLSTEALVAFFSSLSLVFFLKRKSQVLYNTRV